MFANADRRLATVFLGVLIGVGGALPVWGQGTSTQGRFSLFGSWAQRDTGLGRAEDSSELIATFSLRPQDPDASLFDYGLDLRFATYPSGNRDDRTSVYEAWVGMSSPGRTWRFRLGQLWLQELGALGAVGGLHGEYRPKRRFALGGLRFGLFAGLEPEYFDAGFATDIKKGGVYIAVDGDHGRRHVLGWVTIRNSNLVERSVVVFNNFFPIGSKVFVYQAAEYDTRGPGGLGEPDLTYIFVNLRYAPERWLELQGTFHQGRSLDARSITQDLLNGRPVDSGKLERLLFESSRLRVSVRPWRLLTLWATYGRDRSVRDGPAEDQLDIGFSTRDVFHSGLDLTVSGSRADDGTDTYTRFRASLGMAIGRRTYFTLDYSEALAVFHQSGGGGGVVEVRPDTARWALSANVNLNRTISLLLVAERLEQAPAEETRVLVGTVFRF